MSIVLAAIFASLRISIILLRCFHLRTFKTSVHIISDAKTASSCIQYCVWWENIDYIDATPINATVPHQVAFTSVSKEPVSYWCVLIFLKMGLKCQIIECLHMQRCGMMESSVGREKKLSKHSETCGKIWPIWRMLLRYQRDGRRICASIKQNTRILSAHL